MVNTRTVGVVALALVALFLWQTGVMKTSVGEHDDNVDHYTLIVKSSESAVFVSAEVTASRQGEILFLFDARKSEPWHVEFVAGSDEVVTIAFSAITQIQRILGYNGWIRCEVLKNGDRVKYDRYAKTLTSSVQSRFIRASCPYVS